MNTETLKLVVYLSSLTVMFGIESIWPARKWTTPRSKRVFFYIGLSLFNTIIIGVVALAPLTFWKNIVWNQHWGINI